MADQFLRETLTDVRQGLQRLAPEISSKLVLPRYHQPGGYHPYRMLEVGMSIAVLQALMAHTEGDLSPESTAPYYCTISSQSLRFPLFWVAKDLVEAVMNTDAPPDLRLEEIKWPLPAMTFFFPEGLMFEGGREELIAITVVHGAPNTPMKGWGNVPDVWFPEEFVSMWAMTIDHHAVAAKNHENMIGAWYLNDRYTGTLTDFIKSRAKYHKDLETMAQMVFNLILIMQSRPDMVDASSIANTFRDKSTHQKISVFNPRWIGKSYKIRRNSREHTGQSHASPIDHIRRGFWRQQAIGPRIAPSHKRRWIDPVWVMP